MGQMTKILVASNIHGRYEELTNLLHRVNNNTLLTSFDRIVFMGDYIGFGEKNQEVIRFLMECQQKSDKVVLLKGEWEDALYQVMRGATREIQKEAFQLFVDHDQVDMLKALRQDETLLNRWLDTIEDMPVFAEEGTYFISHAGLDMTRFNHVSTIEEFYTQLNEPNYVWTTGNETTYLWFYEEFEPDSFPYTIIMGQTPIHEILDESITEKNDAPITCGHLYCVDFGAKYDEGSLGVVIFDDGNLKAYTHDVIVYPKENKESVNKKAT